MTYSEDIIKELKADLEIKVKQREGVLDRLKLLDVELDKYDELIANIDKDALGYVTTINDSITPVKTAYDLRISSNCKTNLIWKETGRSTRFSRLSGTNVSQTYITYKCVVNEATYDFEPYHGLKYYQRPSNRDYGSTLIAEFNGFVQQGSNVVGVLTDSYGISEVTLVPKDIIIGDTLTDDTENPQIFGSADLPEVIGFGTTTHIGIITSLVCGIATGSNELYHFGGGDISLVQIGMAIKEPDITGLSTTYAGVFPSGYATVTGFSTGTQEIEYYTSTGILSTSQIDVDIINLSESASVGIEEGDFRVGIITTIGAIFISTTANDTVESTPIFAIRADADPDATFDYKKNPNSPEIIGILTPALAGTGHSVFYSTNGDPNQTQPWKPETAMDKIKIPGKDIPAVKEPPVGPGRAEYNIGTFNWPILTVQDVTGYETIGVGTNAYQNPLYTPRVVYASRGTTVTIGGTDPGQSTIGYANSPEGGFPSSCGSIDSQISSAENNMNTVIAENKSTGKSVTNLSKSLRDTRADKETYAWSLLQAAAKTREEIERLRNQISDMQNTDFSKYEKK